MATLGRLVMGLFLDSSQAEQGLDRAKKKTASAASVMDQAAKKTTGLNQSLRGLVTAAKVATGVYLAQTAFGAAQWVSNQFAGVIESGAKLETTAIQFAYLNDSWEKGFRTLNALRETSKETGIALGGLSEGYANLVNAGIDGGSALSTIQGLTNAAMIFGGDGSAGIGKMVGALVDLQETGMATQGNLKGLQAGGLRVYQSLADYLTRVTGRAHTTRDAIFALRNGAVTSGSAIRAIELAAKSPQVEEAAKRFANSFEGQKTRLKTTFDDLFGSLGKTIIDKIGLPRIMAWMRGGADAVGKMIDDIQAKTGGWLDPKNLGPQIKNAFQDGQILAIAIAETLVGGATQAAKILARVVDETGGMLAIGKRLAFQVQNPLQAGVDAAALAMAPNAGVARIIQDDIDRRIGIPRELKQGNRLQLQVDQADKVQKAFFDDLRKKVMGDLGRPKPPPGIDWADAGFMAGGMAGLFRGLAGGKMEKNILNEPMNFAIARGIRAMGPALEGVGKQFDAFTEKARKLEKVMMPLRSFVNENAAEVRNPLENFLVNFQKTADQFSQLAPDIEKLRLARLSGNREAAQVDNALSTIFVRKFGGLLQGLLSEYSPTQSFSGSTALGGSAAAVESIVRAAYSESNADPQARIETAIKRGNIIAERNLQYQMRLIAAMERSMGPAAIVRL